MGESLGGKRKAGNAIVMFAAFYVGFDAAGHETMENGYL
jgi:hypothetical protein